jgi:sec-independent protein translocase protein TatC
MNPEPDTNSEVRLPLTEHLEELRTRLIRSLAAMGVGTVLCYSRAEWIYRALLTPLTDRLPGGSRLIFTELTEAFLTYFKLALWGGFLLASPVIFYQAWRFVSPGLYRKERRVLLVFSFWSTVALIAGMAFGYFVAVPSIFSFFLAFGGTTIVPMPSMRESLSLILRILFLFGVMFELPLVLFLAGWAGILSPNLLRRGRKVAVVGVFLLGAVLTPPDAVSQILVALPLYLLYETGIFLCALGARRREK